MTVFADLIFPVLKLAQARHVVEVGADTGGMTSMLADYCLHNGGQLTSVDPAPTPLFRAWVMLNAQVRHIDLPSLEAFPALADIDAWIIDGDHNWYTVFNEITEIDKLCRRDGKPMLAFFHDVSWPCARRDMYYAPERIPAEFRHPYSRSKGVTLGNPGLLDNRGFRGANNFAWAEHEGGPRNGVLTAIEDFAEAARLEGREFGLAEIPGILGLGVLFDLNALWSGAVAELLLPYHQNKLLQIVEEDRLRNSLRAHDLWEDAQAVSAAS
jgi:Methyltransferase domain